MLHKNPKVSALSLWEELTNYRFSFWGAFYHEVGYGLRTLVPNNPKSWDNVILYFIFVPEPRAYCGRFWGGTAKREKCWTCSYHLRIKPLRNTLSGQRLIEMYKAYLASLPFKKVSEEEDKELKALVYALWVEAHREAGFIEESSPYLDALRAELQTSLAHLNSRLQAEREAVESHLVS